MWGHVRGIVFSFLILFGVHSYADQTTGEKIAEFFEAHIRSPVTNAYKVYYDGYGGRIGESLLDTYDIVAPATANAYEKTKNFIFETNPDAFSHSQQLSGVKVIYEEVVYFAIWQNLIKFVDNPKFKNNLPDMYSSGLGTFSDIAKTLNGNLTTEPAQQKRLEKLLNDLREYSLDSSMSSCLKIHAVPVDDENAETTGCNIFIFKGMYDNLTDPEMRAVIAHEMGHAASGDNIKKFVVLTKAFIAHLAHVSTDEFLWALSNDKTAYFEESAQKGLGEMILEKNNLGVQKIELKADIDGLKVLNAAGFSGNDMISALYKTSGTTAGQENKSESVDPESDHPTLTTRLNAVRKNMKF